MLLSFLILKMREGGREGGGRILWFISDADDADVTRSAPDPIDAIVLHDQKTRHAVWQRWYKQRILTIPIFFSHSLPIFCPPFIIFEKIKIDLTWSILMRCINLFLYTRNQRFNFQTGALKRSPEEFEFLFRWRVILNGLSDTDENHTPAAYYGRHTHLFKYLSA